MRYVIVSIAGWLLFMGCNTEKMSPRDDSDHGPTMRNAKPPAREASAIAQYLSAPTIAPAVENLALIGVGTYQDPNAKLTQARAHARKTQAVEGGRTKSFIRDTFGKDESELINELKTSDPPKTFTVKEIAHAFDELTKNNPRDQNVKKARFILVKGVGINYLHEAPLAKDSFVQLASQFNFLESPGPFVTSVSKYLDDHTQGPMGSIEALAAALHRTASVASGTLPHALTHVLPAHHAHYYRNGYLELFKLHETELKSLYDHLQIHKDKLLILPQWVINESSSTKQIQVFSAAPSYQGSDPPSLDSFGGKICTLLVALQYEAIAKLAVIRSLALKRPVAIHYALVGQGAFNNPPEVISEALKRAAAVVRGYRDVRVYIHGFNANAQDEIRARADKSLIELAEMDAHTFMTATL